MKPPARSLGVPLLCLTASTLLIGQVATTLLPQVPPDRFVIQPPPEVDWLVPRMQAVWLLGQVLLGLFWRLTTPESKTALSRFQRLTWASLFLAIGLNLPLSNWLFIHPLARGRLFLLTYASILALPLWWIFRCRGSRIRIGSSPLASTVALLGGSILTVMLGESFIDYYLTLSMEFVPDYGTWADVAVSLVLNSVLLLAISGALLALTGRRLFSVLTTATAFALLVFADIQKLLHLQTPLSVLDTRYLSELNSVLTDFVSIGQLALVATASLLAVIGLSIVFRRTSAGPWHRTRLLGVCLAVLAGTGVSQVAWKDAENPSSGWKARTSSLSHGLAFDLLIGAISSSIEEPPEYNRATIERLLEQRIRPTTNHAPDQRPNLILWVVESLTDPLDFGFDFTEDPLPFLHSLENEARFGRSISPAFGSQSANAEFELLTGMSMGFLPNGSLPYRQYIHQDTPSLARTLSDLGYHVQALIVDPLTYFERPTALPLLGFNNIDWLDENPDLPHDATGRYASDAAVIDGLIAMDAGEAPFFAFAFSNASHSPYDPAPFGANAIGVVDAPNARVATELGGYANVVRSADNASRRLIAYFRNSERPTLIVIVGDHMPPFTSPAGVYEESHFFDTPSSAVHRRYGVPIWMWANFDIGHEPLSLAHNFIGVTALEAMGIEPDGFLQLVEQVHSKYRALSRVVELRGARPRAINLSKDVQDPLVRDYQLLQYDLLNGEQYANE